MNLQLFQVNAMYVPSFNKIWMPFGILHYPFYLENRIEALNYGALGAILGHEMTHGFDNNGEHFDSNGNVNVSSYSSLWN